MSDTQEQHKNSRPWLAPYQFKPGESGNPGGRPRGLSLTAILHETLDATELCGEPVPGGRTVARALIEAMLAHAIKKGDPSLIRETIARVDGPIGSPPPSDDYSRLSDSELIARVAGALGGGGPARPDPPAGSGAEPRAAAELP